MANSCPHQAWELDLFRPADALGVANLFYAIYGPDYPCDTFYLPDRLRKENQNGNVYSVVARTPAGDIGVHQFLLNQDSSRVGGAVEQLCGKGYFLGGYMPRWFDTDGLLMQKVSGAPDWYGIQLSDATARRILETVRADWEQTRTRS